MEKGNAIAPVPDVFDIFRATCWWLGRKKYPGENILKDTQGHFCRLYFLWRLPSLNGVKVKWYKNPGILFWKSYISFLCIVEIHNMAIILGLSTSCSSFPRKWPACNFLISCSKLNTNKKNVSFLSSFIWSANVHPNSTTKVAFLSSFLQRNQRC